MAVVRKPIGFWPLLTVKHPESSHPQNRTVEAQQETPKEINVFVDADLIEVSELPS